MSGLAQQLFISEETQVGYPHVCAGTDPYPPITRVLISDCTLCPSTTNQPELLHQLADSHGCNGFVTDSSAKTSQSQHLSARSRPPTPIRAVLSVEVSERPPERPRRASQRGRVNGPFVCWSRVNASFIQGCFILVPLHCSLLMSVWKGTLTFHASILLSFSFRILSFLSLLSIPFLLSFPRLHL